MIGKNRKTKLAILTGAVILFGLVAISPTAFAWSKCTLTLTSGSSSTTIPAGSTGTLTFLLTYNDASHPAHFTMTFTSTNAAWTVVSIVPNPTPTITTTQTITVKVTAPTTVSSTTTLTLKAANSGDSAANCQSSATLLTAGFPPPGVPQFPLGMALLLAVAIPALLLVRSRTASKTPSSPI